MHLPLNRPFPIAAYNFVRRRTLIKYSGVARIMALQELSILIRFSDLSQVVQFPMKASDIGATLSFVKFYSLAHSLKFL
jgi:hypothetical protein